MGTAKRERQKANRQLKYEELERQRSRQKAKRRGIQLAIIIPLAVALLVGLVLLLGGDDDTDVAGPGGFTGVTQRYTYARLYNLYLDPKEQHSYLTRKLAYNEAFLHGIRHHLGTVMQFPGKKVMGLE